MENRRNRAIRLFSDGVTHELSNFMNALSLGRQLLEQQVDDPNALQSLENLSDVNQQIDELKERLDLLALPEPDRVQPVNINEFLPKVLSALREEQFSSLAKFNTEAPNPLMVKVDQVALRHLLSELIDNAARASGDEPIQVSLSSENEHVVVSIMDQGPGIPDELESDPLDPFVTSNDQGLGLGLTIVEQITVGHEGTLSISSDPSGTDITISLPRIDSVEATDATS